MKNKKLAFRMTVTTTPLGKMQKKTTQETFYDSDLWLNHCDTFELYL